MGVLVAVAGVDKSDAVISQIGLRLHPADQIPGPIDAALTAFNDAIGDLRRSGTMAQQSADAVARTYSLAFALFQLREDLGDLADRILELADAKMQAAKTPPA